jgi:hypothetical protein
MTTDTEQVTEAPVASAPEVTPLSEAEAVLRHDPFGAAEPEVAPAPEPEVDTGVDGGTTTEAPVAPADPIPQAPTVDPTLAGLLARQTELLEATLAPKTEAAPEAPAAPRFAVQVPDGLVAMLNSDEPADRAAAVNNIVNGVANMAYGAAVEFVTAKITELQSTLPTYINQHTEAATTQRQAQEVFYSAYPKLADPAIRGVVGAVAQDVGKQWMNAGKPFTGMTPEFADAVAVAIAGKFGIPVDAFRATPAVAPAPATPAKVLPFAAPSATRQQGQSNENPFAKLGLDFF